MATHIAIYSSQLDIEAILSGQKEIEARLTRDKIAPFGVISHNDRILLKATGGLVWGEVRVDNVLFYENLTGEMIGKLRKQYATELQVDDIYWVEHSKARYATIIFLTRPSRYLAPVKMEKHDRRSWVVLS